MADETGLQNSTAQEKPATTQGEVHVGGNVDKGIINIGNNNVIYYYAGGEKREMHTGWFFGHRYGDLATFTGRADELKMLDTWLANDDEALLMLRALGGFGKSALAWQWFNYKVDKEQWQTAVWWSFYEKESGFESFLSETLKHLGVEVKTSARQQLNDLLEAMRGTNILIVLDGFERLLRQYGRMDAALQSDDEDADIDPSQRDCSSPLTETFLRGLSGAGTKSKVLMTTRLCPRALESADGKLLKGCRDKSLPAFSPEDAVTYFHNEGIAATRAEIIAACSAYGYHPLSLSLLVGLINEDHEHRGDIEAVKNLEIFEDVRARRHHVLERAYESLAPERRDLLSKISCFRGSMEYAVLKKVFPSPDLDKALLDLRKRGLLQYAGETQRYDMHPIVRHYAYDKFAAPDRTDAHTRLVNYFEAVPTPQTVTTLEDLAPVIELYHHMVRAGNLDEALNIYDRRLSNAFHHQFGVYQIEIDLLKELFFNGEENLPCLEKRKDQVWVIQQLSSAYAFSGNPRRSLTLAVISKKLQKTIKVSEIGNPVDVRAETIEMRRVARIYLSIGRIKNAENKLRRQIDWSFKNREDNSEAGSGFYELGRVLAYRGQWFESAKSFNSSEIHKDPLLSGAQSITASYRALRSLMMSRDQSLVESKKETLSKEDDGHTLGFTLDQTPIASRETRAHIIPKSDFPSINILTAIKSANYALKEASNPPTINIARWLLGASHRANGDLEEAEKHLSESLRHCRQINLIDHEADILLDLARLRYAQGDFKDAQEKASEALVITERCGYVLQGADVNLFLAQYALEQEKDKAKAKVYAEEAKKLATCDGPPYYYKVAYEEAERLLARLSP